MFKYQKPINFWIAATLVLAVFFLLSLATNLILLSKSTSNKNSDELLIEQNSISPAEPVSAQEIYPLFECPCCGQSIDQCTCPMAKERKNYVDALVKIGENNSKDEIILAYVKKYGLDSFMDKEQQKEFREELVKEASADRPIIFLSPYSYDFGEISQKEGITTTLFEIKNEGKSDLIIDRLETSCGCTFAAIVFKGKESPYFTMPGHDNSTDWEEITIPSGETAQLKVYYDPDVHKDFRGSAIREVSVFSNDPIDFEKKVSIELNQVD